ncbi:MAG: FmdE family protein [Nitrospirota bacterium]|nr:FmdE family protein [Nitrospirota bacterium]
MSTPNSDPAGFQPVVAFHGHRCLDIAMGYRVAAAALEALAAQGIGQTGLTATVGNDTCWVDAIQSMTGCTFGKRNLVPVGSGKPVLLLQDASGRGVRVYVHYWETFDRDRNFRTRMGDWKSGRLNAAEGAAFEAQHEARMRQVLEAPAETLFRIRPITLPPPARSGGFTAAPCIACGEHVKESLLVDGRCAECGKG